MFGFWALVFDFHFVFIFGFRFSVYRFGAWVLSVEVQDCVGLRVHQRFWVLGPGSEIWGLGLRFAQ